MKSSHRVWFYLSCERRLQYLTQSGGKKMNKVQSIVLLAIILLAPAGLAEKLHPKLKDKTGDVRVIVSLTDTAHGIETLAQNKCKAHYLAEHADVVVADCPADSLLALSESEDVEFVGEDEVFSAIDAQSRTQVKADSAYATYGTDGYNVKVAIIDTGITTSTVPALSGKVVLSQDFSGEGTTEDMNSHGTAVASVIASQDSSQLGVAPGVNLLNAKAGDASASFVTSNVIQAIDWSIANGARVISMSLGGAVSSCAASPLANYVNKTAFTNNTIFVIGAGNGGPSASSIWSPGCAEHAITVGAVDSGNNLALFSSRGPTDGRVKPDVVAPGVQINTANRDGTWSARDGTSFSTPHVAGVAAMMLQMRSGLYWDEVKGIVKSSAVQLPSYTKNEVGSGLVDALAAVNTATTWPTYANLSTKETYPASAVKRSAFNFNWSGYNTGNSAATNTKVQIKTSSSNLIIVSGANPSIIGSIAARTTANAGWRLQGKRAGTYTVTVNATAGNTQKIDVVQVVVK